MHHEETVEIIVETFYGSTEITTLHIDAEHITRPSFLKGISFTCLIDYFEFDEIINFLAAAFKQSSTNFQSFHTFITKSFFVYNIVFIGIETAIKGAVISGPLIVHYSEDKIMDNIFSSQSLPLHKKQEFKTVLKHVPPASLDRINYLGRFLSALCQSNIKILSTEQQFQGRQIKNTKLKFDKFLSVD